MAHGVGWRGGGERGNGGRKEVNKGGEVENGSSASVAGGVGGGDGDKERTRGESRLKGHTAGLEGAGCKLLLQCCLFVGGAAQCRNKCSALPQHSS